MPVMKKKDLLFTGQTDCISKKYQSKIEIRKSINNLTLLKRISAELIFNTAKISVNG